jgi:hypothetical protein
MLTLMNIGESDEITLYMVQVTQTLCDMFIEGSRSGPLL